MEEPAVGTTDAPPEESSNRIFIIAAAGLAGMFLIGLLCLGGYFFLLRPRQVSAVQTQNAINAATNAAILAAATEAAKPTHTPAVDTAATEAMLTQSAATVTPIIVPTDTDTPIPTPTNTLTPTDTQMAVAQITDTPSPTGVGGAGGVGTSTPTPIGGVRTSTPIGGAGGPTTPSPTPLVGGLTPSPTALAQTGFAEEGGVWGLVFLGLGLIAVVVIVRRVRTSLH